MVIRVLEVDAALGFPDAVWGLRGWSRVHLYVVLDILSRKIVARDYSAT